MWPLYTLVIRGHPFALPQGMQSPIAKATAFVRQLDPPRFEPLVSWVGSGFVMQHAAGQPDKPAGAALGERLTFCRIASTASRLACGLRGRSMAS
ncbi:hypothetical protein CJO94_01040 [Ralstonia solanacearum]|nr:hypothetical protein CJO94_01040 [Ralstonia solanacearum]